MERVLKLIDNKVYEVKSCIYDETNFGNISIVLSTPYGFEIFFVRDRGDFWCEVELDGYKIFIDEVQKALKLPIIKESDFSAYLIIMLEFISAENEAILQFLKLKKS